MGRAYGQSTRASAPGRILQKTESVKPSVPKYCEAQAQNRRVTMVDLGDLLGVLLIGLLFVVVFRRVFEARRNAKIRKSVEEANRDHENDVPHDPN